MLFRKLRQFWSGTRLRTIRVENVESVLDRAQLTLRGHSHALHTLHMLRHSIPQSVSILVNQGPQIWGRINEAERHIKALDQRLAALEKKETEHG